MKAFLQRSLSILVTAMLGPWLAISAYAAPVILTATEDVGMLDGDATVDPFPGILYSELNTLRQGTVWLSVLKFDLSPLAGRTIESATFELTSNFHHTSGTFSHEIFSSSDDNWSELTTHGQNRPSDATLTLLDATDIDRFTRTHVWDVTSGVQGPHGLGGANDFLTLLIRPDLSQAAFEFGPHFNDRQATTGFPRLIVTLDDGSTPVSEPNTSWLLLGAALAAALTRRRRLVIKSEQAHWPL